MITKLTNKVLEGKILIKNEALDICSLPNSRLYELMAAASAIRQHYRSDFIDLCSIVNAKSGGCSEDCSFCAQSYESKADIERYPLKSYKEIGAAAMSAKKNGARRFCLVTGGKKVLDGELIKLSDMLKHISAERLLPCATLGLLNEDSLRLLKDSGLNRYHHNIETSERFFPQVCHTHTFKDKVKTIEAAKSTGLSLCSGGIFGLGETWEDRVEMAFFLRDIEADSIPINFLTPVAGTKMADVPPLDPIVALKIISLYRFILPEREIRICGGRMQTLGEFNSFIYMAGADGLLIGNYLTTTGRSPALDTRFIEQTGLRYK
ncbi:biotin synthase BioB [Candidatus Magnetomonas plexicatena]|nr:biotin synthase BioB [Nitrospirales bacterium LBB_01]